MEIAGCALFWLSWHGAWCAFNTDITRCRSGWLAVLAKGARATGAQRKKAIVAVARQLAVDLWRRHTGRCTSTILGFK
jgi:hypothetical protein